MRTKQYTALFLALMLVFSCTFIVSAESTLRRGSTGSEVRTLQTALNKLGANPQLVVDGSFGPGTEKAVKNYQSKKGLAADGICGPKTWAAINADLKPAVQASFSASISGYTAPTSIKQGNSYSLKGTITANTTIKRVTVSIDGSIKGDVTNNSTSFAMSKVDASVKFGVLSAGSHTIVITAYGSNGSKEVARNQFTVVAQTTSQSSSGGLNADTVYSQWASYVTSSSFSWNGQRYGDKGKYNTECPALVSWFIKNKTTLTYGNGNGKDVVKNLANKNNMSVSASPNGAAVYSVAAGYKVWGASGGSAGHTGIVLSISGNKATVMQTWDGVDKSYPGKYAIISTYTFPCNGVTFLNVGSKLK